MSLFDYRCVTREDLDHSLTKCSPIDSIHAQSPDHGIAIFLLSPSRCPTLLPLSLWKEEEAWAEMIVPYVEAGHKGPISLALVDEVICVEVEPDEDWDPIIARLRNTRKRRDTSD